MAKAVKDGVDLMGYTMWGCIDLVSAGTGEMRKRYGFIHVDRNNDGSGALARYKKDSFAWYKKVIVSDGDDRVYSGSCGTPRHRSQTLFNVRHRIQG